MVCDTVAGAARHFAERLVEIGMEFSPTKNIVLASRRELAFRILGQLRGLKLKVVDNAKSLGGAISSGRFRNTALLAKRLRAFKVQKPQFQKLRRWIGARRAAAAFQTEGAAALVYSAPARRGRGGPGVGWRRGVGHYFVPGRWRHARQG